MSFLKSFSALIRALTRSLKWLRAGLSIQMLGKGLESLLSPFKLLLKWYGLLAFFACWHRICSHITYRNKKLYANLILITHICSSIFRGQGEWDLYVSGWDLCLLTTNGLLYESEHCFVPHLNYCTSEELHKGLILAGTAPSGMQNQCFLFLDVTAAKFAC